MQTFTSQLRRRQLDQVLGAVRTIQPSLTPRGGWIRELRKAIGMTGAQLAKRLHVTAAAITQMEKGEQAGTITLASLRKSTSLPALPALQAKSEPHMYLRRWV